MSTQWHLIKDNILPDDETSVIICMTSKGEPEQDIAHIENGVWINERSGKPVSQQTPVLAWTHWPELPAGLFTVNS